MIPLVATFRGLVAQGLIGCGMRCLPLILVAACSSPPRSKPTPDPVSASASDSDRALATLASELAAVAKPCDVDKVAALFDQKAFLDALRVRLADPRTAPPVDAIVTSFQLGPKKFCAWLDGALDVRLVKVVRRGAESHAILRKVSETGFGHFEVRTIAATDGPHIVDVYSHNNGVWLSEELADAATIPAGSSAALTFNKAIAVDNQGNHVEAVATLDSLPENLRNTRVVQSLRVAFAGKISLHAYEQAEVERARRLPAYKPTPFSIMNTASLRGDYGEALRQIDVMDRAVDGDPFLDSFRASVLGLRNAPGDLDKASQLANQAAEAVPDIAMVYLAKLGIEAVRGDVAAAITTLETLDARFKIRMNDELLRAAAPFAKLVASPEYGGWRKSHP